MSGAVVLQPKKLSGSLAAPPSKSVAHRAVIAASLAKGESKITNIELSQDIEATIVAMEALGARISLEPDGLCFTAVIDGVQCVKTQPAIDCLESGSTLRFLIPVALAVSGGAVFSGSERLGQRPLGPYLDLFREHGIAFEQGKNGFPLTVRGVLKPGRFTVPGNVSSQFVTGLMLAMPLLGGSSEIVIRGRLESLPYIQLTREVLLSFGITVEEAEPGQRYRMNAAQKYKVNHYTVEGDWSQAAFPLLMGLLGGPVAVTGLGPGSRQGDRVIVDILRDMGGDIRWGGVSLTAYPSELRACSVDVSQCPDLAPAIAAAMAVAHGKSRITGGKRLRSKESDRLNAIASCLNALGADATELEDGLIIQGRERLAGGRAHSFNDHRIAMMAAAVSPACAGPVTLEGWESVAKSWPGFWDAFKSLGGVLDGQSMG